MIYPIAGILLALFVAVTAWLRSYSGGGFHDRDVYGMDVWAHRRYAIVSAIFIMIFAVTWALRLTAAGIVALGLYALVAVLYVTSFLQGAHDPDD